MSTALGRMGHAEGGRVRKLPGMSGNGEGGRGKGGGGHDGSCPDGMAFGIAYSLQRDSYRWILCETDTVSVTVINGCCVRLTL